MNFKYNASMQDHNHHSLNIEVEESDDNNQLCCCEYINLQQERTHILLCCCNCSEFDQCCENLLCCHGISRRQVSRLIFMFRDQLRYPWGGGARRMTADTLLPILLIPSMLFFAAQGVWYSFGVFLGLPLALGYLHNYLIKYKPDSKFFVSWAIITVLLASYMFYTMGPIFLFDPAENYAAILLLLASFCCFLRTRFLAKLGVVKSYSILPTSSTESIVNLSDDSVNSLTTSFNITETICPACCKQIPPRAYHCNICDVCVFKRDLHCVWLDCCIGGKNHRIYVVGLILLFFCAALVSDVMLVTMCLPVRVFFSVQVPVDCSEVYMDIMYTQYFVLALYLLVVCGFLLCLIVHEFTMVSLGMTGHEWRLSNNRYYWHIRRASVYSRGFWRNWYIFLTDKS